MLLLSTDVISLVGYNGRDVSISTYDNKEDTKVTNAVIGSVAKEGESNEVEGQVNDNENHALIELVCEKALYIHKDASGSV